MKWLAPIRGGCVVALLIGASYVLCAQNSQPRSAGECKSTIHKADFESRTDGPFVQRIGYSNVLHSCVVVALQGLPTVRDRIQFFTEIVNAVSRKTVWSDVRILRRGNEPLRRYPAFEQQLAKLDIELTLP